MDHTIDLHIQALDTALKALGTPERAIRQKAYLKSPLTFYGVGVPLIRQAARLYHRENPKLPNDTLIRTAAVMWWTGVFEMRSLAIALLETYVRQLTPAELSLVLDLVRDSQTWAHVDWLVKVLEPLLAKEPNRADILRQWAKDDNFWVRRTALLVMIPSLQQDPAAFALFEELAVPMLPEKEFFIRKAIGWVLRDVSKKQPEPVYRFLSAHRAAVSGLTLREGAKYLSPAKRKSLGLKSGSRSVESAPTKPSRP